MAAVMILAAVLAALLNQDRDIARYPGAATVSSHSNYSGLPFEYRWDDSYLVDDNFTAVYNWYSTEFELGAESRANGSCIELDGAVDQLVARRYIYVTVCQTSQGQRVYVTRTTTVKR